MTLIEDETEIAEALNTFFQHRGFSVSYYRSGEDFLKSERIGRGGLYLVDWNLPGVKGVDIVKQIREQDTMSPIFMLSGNCGQADILQGLMAGADDYVTKPFNFEELGQRVENAWAKYGKIEENLINRGLKLFAAANSVIRDGVTLQLTSREFALFCALYESMPEACPRSELINRVGGDNVTSRNVDVHMFSLRKKVRSLDLSIKTHWGTGYSLSLEPDAGDDNQSEEKP